MALTESQVKERIKKYALIVQKYDSPISVAVRLAQLGLESVWFTSELAQKSNNGFGIKASAPWTRDSVEHLSGEVGGARVSLFRKYPTEEASIKDHAGFFTSTEYRQSDKAYGLAIKATNYRDEAFYLGPKFEGDTSSYAGDPKYASKLIGLIEKYNLTQYDTKNKESVKMPKVLLIAGHGLNKNNGYFDAGATGYISKGEHRYFTEDIFPAMKKYLPKGAEAIFHTAYNVYSHNNLVSLAKSYGNDTVVVECHYDAGGTAYSKAGGHVIIYSTFQPDALDLRLRDAIKKTTGLHPHYKDGISKRNNLRNVNSAANGGINYRLIELGMSTHKANGTYMLNNVDTLAKALVEAIWQETNGATTEPTETVDTNNPQGLKTSKPADYVAPRLPFNELEVGGTATILDDKNRDDKLIWQWYDLANNKLLLSERQSELAGKTDVIAEVIELDEPVQHSKVAYKLKSYNSVILEEYVEEARKHWDLVDEEVEEPSDEVATYDGDFVQLHGKRYKIGDEIK